MCQKQWFISLLKIPPLTVGFEELKLHPDILKSLKRSGFVEPTPIQSRCIPEIKAGKDVVGQSLTGSGKTAAFGIPIVEKLTPGGGIKALVLAPTRELALQVRETLSVLSQFRGLHVTTVYGGVGIQPQIDSLRRTDIVVATPGRMLDHISRNTIKLDKVEFLVIDEADKMFEMGFIDDVKEIIRYLPATRQTLLFSATMPAEVHHLITRYLKSPKIITEKIHVDSSLLKQVYFDVKQDEKFSLLVHLLKHKTPGLAIVFCLTRREVDVVTKNLKLQGIHVMAVHGGLSQSQRTSAVSSLKHEKIQVLVATDVAARGLDINNISHIYNYDSPKNSSEYTHRIGRTARAGKKGEAITILSESDHDNFRNVLSDRQIQVQLEQAPQFEKVRFERNTQRAGFSRGPFRGPASHGRSYHRTSQGHFGNRR